ncbi:MAG: helicase HerA-like domain-containing protein [Pseudomonadota bacterium]
MGQGDLYVGGGGPDQNVPQLLLAQRANRHGLVAGATGTGKTVTLQILAESFSAAGVPVFAADVKGDLSGIAKPGTTSHKLHDALQRRAGKIGFETYGYAGFPTVFWDIFGDQGHPVRTTISEMGPLLLARLMDLSEAQEGVLNICFRLADEEGLLLLDLADLRAMLVHVGEHARELRLRFGNISSASVGAIQRRLLVLENQGGAGFFGEPALRLSDLMRCASDGRGHVNILAADRLMESPRLYATVLMWLLSELFEELPEVGDPDRPRLVVFFDEAHLLFNRAPRALVEKVEQVARLIRSKGVGVFFVTQSPDDVPEDVLAQLGNRIQHALRAYTPRERRAVHAAAESFRPNPRFATEEAITALGIGEALTSFLDRKGVPGLVERTLIRPPSSRIGPISAAERAELVAASELAGVYDTALDRVSAHETLTARTDQAQDWPKEASPGQERAPSVPETRQYRSARVYTGAMSRDAEPRPQRSSRTDSLGTTFAKTVIRTAGSQLTRGLVRGVLGGLFRGR